MFELDGVKVHWLGHASFMIEGQGLVVYIDPYIIPENPEKADLILVTHEHFDHCDTGNIERIKKEGTVIVGPEGVGGKLGDVRVLHEDESLDVLGLRVLAVPAYNIGKQFHPRGLGLGFVLSIAGKKIYHAGDTDFIPEMRDLAHLDIDLALLPVGGTYTMDLDQALKALEAIKPKAVIPMHYNSLEGLELSRDELETWAEKVRELGVDPVILDPEA